MLSAVSYAHPRSPCRPNAIYDTSFPARLVYHLSSPLTPCSSSFLPSAAFSLSSPNPRFLNSSFAMRFLRKHQSMSTIVVSVEVDKPVHPTRQIRFRLHPALLIIHPPNALDALQIAHHNILTLPYTPPVSAFFTLLPRRAKLRGVSYHHDREENFRAQVCPLISTTLFLYKQQYLRTRLRIYRRTARSSKTHSAGRDVVVGDMQNKVRCWLESDVPSQTGFPRFSGVGDVGAALPLHVCK